MKNISQVKQNNALLKFLVLTTILFIVLVGILYWQQREILIPTVTEDQATIHFSDRGEKSSVTETYHYGAKYIHDIEAYSQINDLFFNTNFPQLTDKAKLTEALAEVKAEKSLQDEFGKAHVYSTSYYIGNLLILPDLTLHAVLADGSKPNTSILLDTALSDVRSGVVKLQAYFDVAPPFYYDEAYAGAVYFPTASFPSLTVAEAGIVFYLLAEIDSKNARLYEQFLLQYTNQVLASGANFYIDIEYALKLVSAYFAIIKESPDYKNLLLQAKEEWEKSERVSLVKYEKVKFPLNSFPYESRFEILKPKVNAFKNTNNKENLAGQLMLSLVDNRLPEPVGKMYLYDIINDSLLPFSVELQNRKYPFLGKAVVSFAGNNQDKYFFVSGDKPKASESGKAFLSQSQIFYRAGDIVLPLDDDVSPEKPRYVQKNLELSSGQDRLLYNQFLPEQEANPDIWDVKLDKLTQGKLLKSDVITRGASPALAFLGERVLFWREGGVWQINTNSGFEEKIIILPEQSSPVEKIDLDYLEETQTLVISRTYKNLDSLEPTTEILIYKVEKSGESNLSTKKVYEVEMKDTYLSSIKQSPGGSHLAMIVNETGSGRESRLLIFNINDGIIKKELDLEPFSNKAMAIDSWLSI